MIPIYNTKKFNEIFPDAASFKDNYDTFQATAGLTNILDDTDVAITWQLLTAKYGSNPIANWSEDQFKIKVWQIMFQYGPTWVKRNDIQGELRALTADQIKAGEFNIYNTALNPATTPSDNDTTELNYINQQNTSRRQKSVLGAYNELMLLLDTDVTAEYIDRFKKLFMVVVDPANTFIYTTEGEE